MKRKFMCLLSFGVFITVYLIIELHNVRNRSAGEFSPPQQFELRLLELSRFASIDIVPNRSTNIDYIQQLITLHNRNQRILNYEKFGPVTNNTLLITIQVHNRISYLTHLLVSLSVARDIKNVLLIISHDIYDDALNQLVEEIDFCMVIQIFYPFSIQTHPLTFPGNDPNDCPRNTTRIEANRINCTGQADKHGHYREAKFTQMKHHWWWKLNRIFDQLEVTKYHNGLLLLLEEDYFVAEDFIQTLKLLQETAQKSCDKCNIISLGTHKESIDRHTYDIMDISPWKTSEHNMGMAFSRITWNSIKRCAGSFCDYDEYNYDFSLQNVNRKCLEQKLLTAIIRGPRVYHIGTCGVHHGNKVCKSDDEVKNIKKKLKVALKKRQLYPPTLKLGRVVSLHPMAELKPFGGWGDERDRNLCLNMTM